MRVRTPRTDRVEPMTLDSVVDAEEADREKERREEEGRGYEGMIRPLYLEEGAGLRPRAEGYEEQQEFRAAAR